MQWKICLQTATLVGIGCLQMIGDVFGLESLKALGLISHASPAPKVFTTQNGYETYSPIFIVTALAADGNPGTRSLTLTPQINARVGGPYNRRNAYGAVISYGPVLANNAVTKPMFEAAFRYGFCNAKGVARAIGLPEAARYRVEIRQRKAQMTRRWLNRFEVNCNSGVITTNHIPREA